MALQNVIADDNYFNQLNRIYKIFYNPPLTNGKINIKNLGTDIFYYKDGKHDAIFKKYLYDQHGVKLNNKQDFFNLYDELLNVEDNLNSDKYVVIDISSLYDTRQYNSQHKCEVNNIFGIEYMLRRYYTKQKKLNIYTNEFFYNINSKEAFDKIFFDKLIDDLFNPDMYIGTGRGTDNKEASGDINNTNANIAIRLHFYINYYNEKLKIYNANNKYIKYENGNYISISGNDKKIFVIGDIHADFPRLVQILYNSGFIIFEGKEWNKVNFLNEASYKSYLHSPNIFKEIKWIAKNTILLFAGDLIDSTGRNYTNTHNSDDETGDYELRIHLMILILREQAMKDNESFVHYVMGNHDTFMDHYKKRFASINSLNKLFNSYQIRKLIIKKFYLIYNTFYVLLKSNNNTTYLLSHGSFNFNNQKHLLKRKDLYITNITNDNDNDIIKNMFFMRNTIEDYNNIANTKFIENDDNTPNIYKRTELFKNCSNLDNTTIITHFIFGHSPVYFTLNEEYQYQHNNTNDRIIFSTCNNHCFFVDSGLSKAFDNMLVDNETINNNFYELLYVNQNDRIAKSAHFRVYTDKNRFKLGSRQAELFYDSNATKTHFTPILEDIGNPIQNLLLS